MFRVDDHDRHGRVPPTVERKLDAIMICQSRSHRATELTGHFDGLELRWIRRHVNSFVCGADALRTVVLSNALSRVRLHNDDLGYETNCFVCEQSNAAGLRIPFFHDTDRDLVTADFVLGGAFSGAPSMLHGGVTLAILDEAMAWACIAIGRQWAVTSETSTKFHRAIYVDKPHVVESGIIEQTDAHIVTEARIVNVKGVVRAEARATFTALGEAQMKRAVGLSSAAELDPSMRLD